jgi:hypothetical protein
MFTYTSLILEPMSPYQEAKIEFPYTGDIQITDLTASCGCSVPTNDKEKKVVRVNFTAQEIPRHLAQQGQTHYTAVKIIKVKYHFGNPHDSHEQTLQFTVLVKMPEKK